MLYKSVANLSDQEIADIASSESIFLVGSAISSFKPTAIPTGGDLVNETFRYIFKDNTDKILKEIFHSMPFEAVTDCHPCKERLQIKFQDLFLKYQFNDIHKLLSEKLLHKKIYGIITPNFDMAFDGLLKDKPQVTSLKNANDCKEFNKKENHVLPFYFKIHGSADEADSMIFTLEHEKRLDGNKAKTLQTLVEGKNIIVIGYSGRDLDICPLLANTKEYKYKKLYWLHYHNIDSCNSIDSELSIFAKLLLKSSTSHQLITGNLIDFLNKCFNDTKPISPERELNSIFDASRFFILNEKEKILWKFKLLRRMACANIILEELEKNKKDLSVQNYCLTKAHAHSHRSEYLKAAKLQKTLLAQPKLGFIEKHELLSDITASYLPHTSYLQALYYYLKSKSMLNKAKKEGEDITPNKLNLMFNNLNYAAYFYKAVPLSRFLFKIWAKNILKCFEKMKVKELNHFTLDQKQKINFLFQRMYLNDTTLFFDEFVLEAQSGSENLGLPSDEILSYRQNIGQKTFFDPDEFCKLINKAQYLGKYAEIWKLYQIRCRKFDKTSAEKRSSLREWKKYLPYTEYGAIGTIVSRFSYIRCWTVAKFLKIFGK